MTAEKTGRAGHTATQKRSSPQQGAARPTATDGSGLAPEDRAAAARVATVARLKANGGLTPRPVHKAPLALPREFLMPQAYMRRSAPDEKPRLQRTRNP